MAKDGNQGYGKGAAMRCIKQTDKALLMESGPVLFWIQKRWLRSDWSLTKEGLKAYHIARKAYLAHVGFNALEEFETVQATEKAVLLRCAVDLPGGGAASETFWLPRSMAGNYDFVKKKVREVEGRQPFTGARARWSGNAEKPKQKRGKGEKA
jgi:hypothetical protein